MPDCLLTKPVFSLLQWVASIDVQENEEASANVVVKMTDSFTEQADQVTPGKDRTWGGEPWGEGSTGGAFFLLSGVASLIMRAVVLMERNLEKVKGEKRQVAHDLCRVSSLVSSQFGPFFCASSAYYTSLTG